MARQYPIAPESAKKNNKQQNAALGESAKKKKAEKSQKRNPARVFA
jgi:hypothetical protein